MKRISPRTANRRIDAIVGVGKVHQRPIPKMARQRIWWYWNRPPDTTSEAQKVRRLKRRLKWMGSSNATLEAANLMGLRRGSKETQARITRVMRRLKRLHR